LAVGCLLHAERGEAFDVLLGDLVVGIDRKSVGIGMSGVRVLSQLAECLAQPVERVRIAREGAQQLVIGGCGILPAARQRQLDRPLRKLAIPAALLLRKIGRVGHLLVILLILLLIALIAAPVPCVRWCFSSDFRRQGGVGAEAKVSACVRVLVDGTQPAGRGSEPVLWPARTRPFSTSARCRSGVR
jgi:hypothetical protein